VGSVTVTKGLTQLKLVNSSDSEGGGHKGRRMCTVQASNPASRALSSS